MTLVAAIRNESRVVIMSDTAIFNKNAAHPNALPGRLKAVVLRQDLTISYAGLSSQALDAIREVRRLDLSPADAVDALQSACRRYPDELDFLLCSHENRTSPRLVKITSAGVYEGADQYWIGHVESAQALAKHPLEDHYSGAQLVDFQSASERQFVDRFFDYMQKSRDPNIGGAVVNCLCSEFGHCYQDHVGDMCWEPFSISDLNPPEVRSTLERSGRGSFVYHLYCPAERGVALVGFYMPQPGIGYLYVPLTHDDPILVQASSEADFRKIVSITAAQL